MSGGEKVFLDTADGMLELCRRGSGSGAVNVYRIDAASQRIYLGFSLCAKPDTTSLFGRLSNSEYKTLIQYLTEIIAMRDAEHHASMLICCAAELAASTIIDPETSQKLQQIAELAHLIQEEQGLRSSVFATAPTVLIRSKIRFAEGFKWRDVVDGAEEIYHTGVGLAPTGEVLS